METDAAKLRNYLLGDLSENEAEAIDLQVINSENFTEELFMVEESLIEDYLDERLSAAELELFHRNFLISEERKNQVKEIAALRSLARNFQAEKSSDKAPRGFFQNSGGKIFLSFRQLGLAFAGLLVIGFLSFFLWQFGLFQPSSELALLENEAIALNKQDLSDLSRFENIPKLSLAPILMRGAEETTRFSAANSSETILIRLALPAEEKSEGFNAKIIRSPNETLTLSDVEAYSNRSGREIRLLVSSQFIKPGEYKIEITPANEDDNPLNYSFSVNTAQ